MPSAAWPCVWPLVSSPTLSPTTILYDKNCCCFLGFEGCWISILSFFAFRQMFSQWPERAFCSEDGKDSFFTCEYFAHLDTRQLQRRVKNEAEVTRQGFPRNVPRTLWQSHHRASRWRMVIDGEVFLLSFRLCAKTCRRHTRLPPLNPP